MSSFNKCFYVVLCTLISEANYGNCNSAATAINRSQVVNSTNSEFLSWDSVIKTLSVTYSNTSARFIFNFTNILGANVTITNVHPSCGCTTVQLPVLPWIIPLGTNGKIEITVNLAGKSGTLFKTVTINTDKGSQVLSLKIGILPPVAPIAATTNQLPQAQPVAQMQATNVDISPANQTQDLPAAQAMFDPDRARSFQMARLDRQAVFKGDCANCHVKPTEGKYGKELFDAACGICHEGEHRATMVPDLHHLKNPTSEEFWRAIITAGRPNTLMPAFAKLQGGSLTELQIASLAAYLASEIPSHSDQVK